MPLTPRGLYRIKLIGELHGQLTETAFHFVTSEVSAFDRYDLELNALMEAFIQSILPLWQGFCSQEWAAKTVTGITLIPAQEVFIEKGIVNGGGSQPDDSLPSFCAALLSLRTGKGGRSRIGRLYVPGVAEGLSSQSRLEGNYLGLLRNLGAALTSTFGNNGSYPWNRYGVFSRKLGVTRHLLPTPHLDYSAAGFQIVTTTVPRPEVATMRRRKLARGL
jgi:hypothetical protein